MQTENDTTKPEDSPEQEAGEGCSGATCSAWVPITERLPKVGRRVLVCCQYTDRQLITIAKWQPSKTIDGQFWDDYPEEWEDADEDLITNPTDLWVEYPLEIEQCGFVGNVTHWMPLPSLPNDPGLATAPQDSDS